MLAGEITLVWCLNRHFVQPNAHFGWWHHYLMVKPMSARWHRCSDRLGKRPATGRWHWSPACEDRTIDAFGAGWIWQNYPHFMGDFHIINGIWSFTSWCFVSILFSLGMFGLFVLLLWCFWSTPSLDLGRPRCLGYHQPPGSPPAWWVRRESPGYAKDTRTRWGASWQIPLAPSQPNLRESPRCYAWLNNAKHVHVIFMFLSVV